MGIHRARFVLAVIALAGLAGCQSGSSNNLAFWKPNPLSSKTAASTPKPQYPAKPSTQVPNPKDTTAPAASGLASSPASRSSPTYPGAPTSFTTPSKSVGGSSPVNAGVATSGRGASPGSASTMDPVVSPQRGYYATPPSGTATRSTPAGVSAPSGTGSYPPTDPIASRSSATPSSGFRSGAKDYTSPATDYTASSSTGSTRSGAIIPRYGASADRYGAAVDQAAAPSDRAGSSSDRFGSTGDRFGSGTRAGQDVVAVAPGVAATPYGSGSPYANPATPSGTRGGATDPFQAATRSSPYAAPSGAGFDRNASAYPAASTPGTDRNSATYVNPYANAGATRTAASPYDRPGTPNYRDYPSTDASGPRANGTYNPPSGNYAPAAAASGAPAGDYRPGATGYNPPASDYRPGDTGYNPSSTSPYRAPSGSAAPPPDDFPPYRPGSTSDYVPKSANPGPAASTAARDLFGPRSDSSVQPTEYTAGGSDYRR